MVPEWDIDVPTTEAPSPAELRDALADILTLLKGQRGVYWTDERRLELDRIARGIGVVLQP